MTRQQSAQTAGLALAEQRGPEYMRMIGRSGALKRKTFGGGRPWTADCQSHTQPVEASYTPVSLFPANKNMKGVMPATAYSTLLAEWGKARTYRLGESPI